jgi:hypothetical protein
MTTSKGMSSCFMTAAIRLETDPDIELACYAVSFTKRPEASVCRLEIMRRIYPYGTVCQWLVAQGVKDITSERLHKYRVRWLKRLAWEYLLRSRDERPGFLVRSPHMHAEAVKAWADGYAIEYYHTGEGKWNLTERPTWLPLVKYRIAP